MTVDELRSTIDAVWDDLTKLEQSRDAIEEAVDLLDQGKIRTAELKDGHWTVNQWVKKTMNLYMKLRGHSQIGVRGVSRSSYSAPGGFGAFPLKSAKRLERIWMPVPSVIRHGSYIGDDARILVSFVSMGAWIGSRTMVVNGASVGLCAQVGEDVFISSGASLGSVMMMPLHSGPVIVEDGAYVGMHCVISESTDPYFDHPASTADGGVVVGSGAVLGANVVINSATPLVDVTGEKPREINGPVPPRAVVVSGTVARQFPAGDFQVPASLIIGWRDEGPDLQKTLHDALTKYRITG
jgi:2,3,4,5-tetrahydropyridine-2,6-dicarboxylate N-succinyltransferase